MKNKILLLAFCAFSLIVKSQNTTSVEKSTFGIQTGFAGLWVHNELKLSNQVALRTEVGFDANFGKEEFYPDTDFLFKTVIALEPRWYYNLSKRESNSKSITGNSGNFFSLKTSLHHSDLVIDLGGEGNVNTVTDLSFIPTWGMRRNLGEHFNYEAGFGAGYIHYFGKDAGFSKDKGEFAINLHLRIGYRF